MSWFSGNNAKNEHVDKKDQVRTMHLVEEDLHKTLDLKSHNAKKLFEEAYKREFVASSIEKSNEYHLQGFQRAANHASTMLQTTDPVVKAKAFGYMAGSVMGSIESALTFRKHRRPMFTNKEFAQFEHVMRAMVHFNHLTLRLSVVKEIHRFMGRDDMRNDHRSELTKLGLLASGKF